MVGERVVANGTFRTGLVLLVVLSSWGCTHLDAQPDDLALLKREAAAQQLLSKILRECAIAAGSSICRRALPDFCMAAVTVEGNAYRCPGTAY